MSSSTSSKISYGSRLLASASSMATSASSVASTTASLANSTASSAFTASAKILLTDSSAHLSSEEDAKTDQLIEAMGLGSESPTTHIRAERDRIFKLFEQIGDLQEQEKGVLLEAFVKAMMVEMKSTIQWADAAFRAFVAPGKSYLGKREFALAMTSLKTTKASLENPTWLQLRRRVLFVFYNKGSKSGTLGFSDFTDMLDDLSELNKDPELYGISNKTWSLRLHPPAEPPKSAADHDVDSVVKELIMTKLALAMKKCEMEDLLSENARMRKQLETLNT